MKDFSLILSVNSKALGATKNSLSGPVFSREDNETQKKKIRVQTSSLQGRKVPYVTLYSAIEVGMPRPPS